MNIIGKGHHSIVVAWDQNTIIKYYDIESEAINEESNLLFLESLLQKGLDLTFKIPKYFSKEEVDFNYDGISYSYKACMERIQGDNLSKIIAWEQCDLNGMGIKLARASYEMISKLSFFWEDWSNINGQADELFIHIIDDKAEKVLQEEENQTIFIIVKEAMEYLLQKEICFKDTRTLSHIDMNFGNIIINDKLEVEWFVDWGSFWYTYPALVFYQMVTHKNLWASFENEFKKLWGDLEKDILYAAAIIHNAWSPLKLQEMWLPYDRDAYHQNTQYCYEKFKNYAQN